MSIVTSGLRLDGPDPTYTVRLKGDHDRPTRGRAGCESSDTTYHGIAIGFAMRSNKYRNDTVHAARVCLTGVRRDGGGRRESARRAGQVRRPPGRHA